MSCVKLAIRIRPFTDRESKSERERVRVIDIIDEHTVAITNTKVSVSGAGDSRERVRRYNADYTFDSACLQTLPSYATQEKIFETIGGEVMATISRGYSACVLAYGQSATGKTFTMFGNEIQPGLVPRLCRAFANQEPFNVTISFLEIYNERVHDLLVGDAVSSNCNSLPRTRGNARKDLRVREHPSKGPYVQNLRRVTVNNAETLLSLANEGIRRRRTAATRRNPSSSRSHALLEIVTPRATLHLADLAGSEKAGFDGTGSGRQKEGANINKSLVALSNVISALVTIGRGRTKFIPYRDSALTWLLKDCFTGGSSTFIIATVSPSVACYGESASTLRWAERASQLPTKRVVSCEANIVPKADLQAQFNKLLAELTKNYIIYIPETGKIKYEKEHWNSEENTNKHECINISANIGNIMNKMHPKTDAKSSESTDKLLPVASGSSDAINTINNEKITTAVTKEVDKMLGASLERTNSGGDLKVVAPLRHKRREYRSQEVLPMDESLASRHNASGVKIMPSQSEVQIDKLINTDKIKIPRVSVLHENQRAEIVAAVTERLYTKLKKKEEAAVSRVESMVDKKIMEPLSELKICTNARQRLIELSQKAMRNKRRIGIPAFTQTRRSVIRVKDQGTDVQTDLDSYIAKHNNSYIQLFRDVGTETIPMTPRCKEIAVGSKYGSLRVCDKSTATEKKNIVKENSYTMTDQLVKYDHFTQTMVIPPPRRKRRNKSTNFRRNESKVSEECTLAPVISINISQTYPNDSETQSSDEPTRPTKNVLNIVTTTPDLLTNHTGDTTDTTPVNGCKCKRANELDPNSNHSSNDNPTELSQSTRSDEDFSDGEECPLPRVTGNSSSGTNCSDMKNMILGRNKNMYPYNIILSPAKEKDNSKRIVTFKDIDGADTKDMAPVNCPKVSDGSLCNQFEKTCSSDDSSSESKTANCMTGTYSGSDSTESIKEKTNSFIWQNDLTGSKTLSCPKSNYVPVYKSNPRYKTAKGRFYRQYLGFDQNVDDEISDLCTHANTLDSKDFKCTKTRDLSNLKKHHFPKVTARYDDTYKCDEFGNIEKKIFDACTDLERSVNTYDDYITSYRDSIEFNSQRTPKKYLQHLIKIRREMVKTEDESTNISANGSRS